MDAAAILARHLGAPPGAELPALRCLGRDDVAGWGCVERGGTLDSAAPHAPVAQGLMCEEIFGPLDDDEARARRFGRIELPLAIEHPFSRDGEWMLDFIPVLPAAFRPAQAAGGQLASDPLNELYRFVVARRNRLRIFLERDAASELVEHERRMLSSWVEVLFHNVDRVPNSGIAVARWAKSVREQSAAPDPAATPPWIGLLDRLGDNAAILARLAALARGAGDAKAHQTACTLTALGFRLAPS